MWIITNIVLKLFNSGSWKICHLLSSQKVHIEPLQLIIPTTLLYNLVRSVVYIPMYRESMCLDYNVIMEFIYIGLWTIFICRSSFIRTNTWQTRFFRTLWKININSDVHQYQQNEQTELTIHKKSKTCDIESPGPGLGQAQKCGRVKTCINPFYFF